MRRFKWQIRTIPCDALGLKVVWLLLVCENFVLACRTFLSGSVFNDKLYLLLSWEIKHRLQRQSG